MKHQKLAAVALSLGALAVPAQALDGIQGTGHGSPSVQAQFAAAFTPGVLPGARAVDPAPGKIGE